MTHIFHTIFFKKCTNFQLSNPYRISAFITFNTQPDVKEISGEHASLDAVIYNSINFCARCSNWNRPEMEAIWMSLGGPTHGAATQKARLSKTQTKRHSTPYLIE